MSRARAWCFTLNNYTDDEKIKLKDFYDNHCSYMIYGHEVGEKRETPHLQGFLYLINAKTFDAMKKKLPPRVSFRVSCDKESGYKNAIEYCTKEGDFVEFGEPPQQGKRNDIQVVREILQETPTIRNVLTQATSFQSIRIAEVYLKYFEKPRTTVPYVEWYWGPSGRGKTHNALQSFLDKDYYIARHGKWYDGYDGHLNVIFDDLRPTTMSYNTLLGLLHDQIRVESKGGSRQFLATHIIITSCYSPQDFYDLLGLSEKDSSEQLLSRINIIKEFSEEINYREKQKCVQNSENKI